MVAFRFDVRKLNPDMKQYEPDYKIVQDTRPYLTLPLPQPEQKMV